MIRIDFMENIVNEKVYDLLSNLCSFHKSAPKSIFCVPFADPLHLV